MDFDDAVGVQGDDLVGGRDGADAQYWGAVGLDFVDYGRDVWVPDADFMVETRRK